MRQLTQKDIEDLKRSGYTEQEIAEAIREIQQEEGMNPQTVQQARIDPRMYAQHSAFAPQMQDNLIKWQLELDNILERAEHILRGDKLVFINGSLIWKPNENTENNILNDYGVSEVMRILSMYLNRNTILSDYSDEEIREKVLDFGRELSDLFYMKYQEMGLNISFEEAFNKLYNVNHEIIFSEQGIKIGIKETNSMTYLLLNPQQVREVEVYQHKLALEKRKNYPMLVRELVDIIHSAYKRALHGGEKRSLREARQITQTEQIAGMGRGVTINANQQPQSRGVLNPFRYVVGKYK